MFIRQRREIAEKVDIRKVAMQCLDAVENEIEIHKIKSTNNYLRITVKDEEQQRIVMNQLKTCTELTADKSAKKLPSFMLKELDKTWSRDYIIEQLVEKEGVDREQTVIKALLSNDKFRTNRAIVQFGAEDTARLIGREKLKLKHFMHPIERTEHVIQCRGCLQYGHFHRDKQGQVTCNRKQKCAHCSGEHPMDQCPSTARPPKCANCGGGHRAYSRECSKRVQVITMIRSRMQC